MSYELLEQSKREFKKDSRRVAIKVKALHFRWSYYVSFFLKNLFLNFRIFLNAPKKKKSMHYWARIILKQHTLTKITNLARWDNLDFQTRLPRTVRGGLYAFSAVESASTGLLSVLVISSFFQKRMKLVFEPEITGILGRICKWGWSCPMHQWNWSQRLRKGFSTTHRSYFKDWVGKTRGLEPIKARGWHLEAKYTASDFMICVSHFPLEWNEKEFKDLIKDFGETEKCFLVRKSFKISKNFFFTRKTPKIAPIVENWSQKHSLESILGQFLMHMWLSWI